MLAQRKVTKRKCTLSDGRYATAEQVNNEMAASISNLSAVNQTFAVHSVFWQYSFNASYARCKGRDLMRIIKSLLFPAVVILLVAGMQAAMADTPTEYQLYFLGGQSNMEGFGTNSELSGEWHGEVDRVMIFTGRMVSDNEPGGGAGTWDVLRPGHGTGFMTDGEGNTLSGRFGPELSFGKRMADLQPSAKIAIIKYSRGGSSLQAGASGFGTWEPDFEEGARINQYDNALTAIRDAMSHADIDGDGQTDHLVPAGIVWMQGEADAYHSRESAQAYQENLKRMMDLLRAALRVDDLPVVIGRITDSGQAEDGSVMDYIGTVQQAQRDFTDTDRCAVLVTATDEFGYIEDGWHYDTEGYLVLGAAFADAVFALEADCR